LWAELQQGKRIGDLPPHSAQLIGSLEIANADRKRYFVQIEARNGTFNQPIRLRKVNGEWKVATQVTVSPDGKPPPFAAKPVYKRIDAGFPLNNRGEVDW
jgi:hypothetical protein